MGGRAIDVEVILFDILTVVAFAVRQAEQTLLEDRILAVPQTDAQAEPLLVIADPGKTILSPVIRTGSGLVVAEIVPGITIRAVVLAHRPPLPFAQVRPPLSP